MKLTIRKLVGYIAGTALVLFASSAVYAEDLVPAEDFARRAKFNSLRFSPDNKRFVALEEYKGRMNVVTGELGKSDIKIITTYEKFDVNNPLWISDKRIIFTLTDYKRGLADQKGGGLFAVDIDGRNGKQLSLTGEDCEKNYQACRQFSFFDRVPESEDEIIAESNERSADSMDLVRLNTKTGKKVLLSFDNPGQVFHWALDKDMVPRAALSRDRKSSRQTFWYKDKADAPWRKVIDYDILEPGMEPLDFGPDGTLYVSSRLDSKDKSEIFKFDPAKSRPGERVAKHLDVDLGLVESPSTGGLSSPLLFDSKTNELIGIKIEGDMPSTVWLDEKLARVQKTIDNSLAKGNINRIKRLEEGKYFILSEGGSDPGAFYIFDDGKRQLLEIGRRRNWIKPEQMARVEVVRYKARDGLEIPAYLTLPPGKQAKKLPLVVWVHGGPFGVRDEYRFDPEVQFIASRGYAVLQVNYRISGGFGLKHYAIGFRQFGQAMQTDLRDGVNKLIQDGTVDANKVCIGGGSYGGYATMMGLIRDSDLYKCGINIVGVMDLFWWQDLGYTDFNLGDAESASIFLKRVIGDPVADGEMMRANSPRFHADKVKAPVLFIHGVNDRRVPIVHAESMRDALKTAGKPYEWLVFPDEGHGFNKESSRAEYYRKMESFLAQHIGK
jgi:dipeptidyl aminopeptidase/acylaminoacyl peptidase